MMLEELTVGIVLIIMVSHIKQVADISNIKNRIKNIEGNLKCSKEKKLT